MKFTGFNLQMLDKVEMQKLSLQEALPPSLQEGFLKAKNVILTGEFFPLSSNSFRENLLEPDTNVQSGITPETEVLICGKYPDWSLVEEARQYGISIIFIDRAGELFSKIASKLNQNKTASHPEEFMEV